MNFLNQTPITVWVPAMKIIVIALMVVFVMLVILAITKGSEILGGLAIVFFCNCYLRSKYLLFIFFY